MLLPPYGPYPSVILQCRTVFGGMVSLIFCFLQLLFKTKDRDRSTERLDQRQINPDDTINQDNSEHLLVKVGAGVRQEQPKGDLSAVRPGPSEQSWPRKLLFRPC